VRDAIAGWLDPSNDTFEITQTAGMTDFQTTPAFVSARKNHDRAAARAQIIFPESQPSKSSGSRWTFYASLSVTSMRKPPWRWCTCRIKGGPPARVGPRRTGSPRVYPPGAWSVA
jgi:hypothetical protein